MVAPLVGAWIEIKMYDNPWSMFKVAPLVGAWIEIMTWKHVQAVITSLPSWERGLKWHKDVKIVTC